jgi:phosphohistidine swiveling domain-containing protein
MSNTAQDATAGAWAVTWDIQEDGGRSWAGGKELVKPLQQSLSLYYYQGWAKAFSGLEARGGLRARFVQGYEYRCWRYEPLISWEQTSAAQQAIARELPARWQSEWLPSIQADLARWRAVDLAALRDDELAVHLHDMLNRQLRHWEIHAYMGSVPLEAVQRLVDWYLERFPAAPESEPYILLQGQPNVSTESNHQLWMLSNEVNYAIEEALRSEVWSDLPSSFAASFRAYLVHFGDGTPDNHRRTARLILAYAKNEVPDPYVDMQRLAAGRTQFTTEVRARLAPEEQPIFDELLALALDHNPLTEDHNLYLDQQSNGATRLVCQEFGRRLAAAGILVEPGEVEYLALPELLQWGFGLADPLRPRIAERKTQYAMYARLNPPSYLGQPPQPTTWVDRFGGPAITLDGEPGTIQGVGASPGLVRGVARIARTLDEALALAPGEVLVCPATDPRWTPLFALASALVTDHGGSLAHAAVIAREMRLPAVVGTHRATQQIHTGQLLEVDGRSGIVRLL